MAPVSVSPAKVPLTFRSPSSISTSFPSPVARASQADRLDAVLLPAVEPGEEMPAEALDQVVAGDLPAALGGQRGASQIMARLAIRPVAADGNAEADHQPVGDLVAGIDVGAGEADAADDPAVQLQAVGPAEVDGDDRRDEPAESVAERQHGDQRHRH
jgi:hypothetical protein